MNALWFSDAHDPAAPHPRRNMRWRLQRCNPVARLRWQKKQVADPATHHRAHTGWARKSLVYYLRFIRCKLHGTGRHLGGGIIWM